MENSIPFPALYRAKNTYGKLSSTSINQQLKKSVMAELKRRTLFLSSGKQIKLFGGSVAIGKSLEIGEGYAPNIFSCISNKTEDKTPAVVSNPHQLNLEEMIELADFNIQLWMDLKANIRKHGVGSSRIFNREAGH